MKTELHSPQNSNCILISKSKNKNERQPRRGNKEKCSAERNVL